MKALLFWILSYVVAVFLSNIFNGKFFILRCILVIPFTYLAVKETFKIFKK